MTTVTGAINNGMRAKLKVILDGYSKGTIINTRKIALQFERNDRRVHMKKGRISSFLREFDDLVVYQEGKWVRI